MSEPLQIRLFQSHRFEFRKRLIEFALLRKAPCVTKDRFGRNCLFWLGRIDCLPLCGYSLTVGRAYAHHRSEKQ